MAEPVIVDGVRTPFAKSGTVFRDVPPEELGRVALNELLQKTGLDPNAVDEVIIGTVSQMVDTANIARVIAQQAGIPVRVPAYTVNRNCASGLEAVGSAMEKIRSGLAEVVLAGGVESMSTIPIFYYGKKLTDILVSASKAKTLGDKFRKLASLRLRDLKPSIISQTDPLVGMRMGDTAEVLAKEFGVTRREQDEFALMSHHRAVSARSRLEEEIVPYYLPPKYEMTIKNDVAPRDNQEIEHLASLKPIFDLRNGSVTAGNASPITDGAAALLIMNEDKARQMGYKPIGRIRAYAYTGLDPARMGLGPSFATPLALDRAGMKLADMDLIEMNEAFAAQVIANEKAFASVRFAREQLNRSGAIGEIDRSRLNVNGGAIAVGHPLGATGARLILTLLYELRRRNGSRGLITLCIGGGQGAAFVLSRE